MGDLAENVCTRPGMELVAWLPERYSYNSRGLEEAFCQRSRRKCVANLPVLLGKEAVILGANKSLFRVDSGATGIQPGVNNQAFYSGLCARNSAVLAGLSALHSKWPGGCTRRVWLVAARGTYGGLRYSDTFNNIVRMRHQAS